MPATATRAAVVEMPLLFEGDVVTIDPRRYAVDPAAEYVVHTAKRSKAIVKAIGDPTSPGFDVDMSALIKVGRTCMDDIHAADEAQRVARAAAAAARAEATPCAGAVVRLDRACGTYTAGTLMSVEKINQTTVSLNRLGGNNAGEFGMRIDPRGVTIIDLADLAAALG